jgi:hypothetical protein
MQQQGYTIAEIAVLVGKSYSSVANLLADPDGRKQRARRMRYQGTCVDCGRPTNGSNGYAKAPTRCAPCAAIYQHEQKYWTRERIIAAIQRWADEHDGEPPRAPDWTHAGPARLHPASSTVYAAASNPHAEFASWSEALAAAGFPGNVRGKRRDPETWRANLRAAQRRRRGHTRDYGEMELRRLYLPLDQWEALQRLGKPSVTEHVRRAIDLYLQTQAATTGEDAQATEGMGSS